MASRTVRLQITVKYEDQDDPQRMPTFAECRGYLENVAEYAANRGMLSGDSSLIVGCWSHSVADVGISP